MACDHAPSPDPRKAGCCVKCGHPIPPDTARPRDLVLERELCAVAARAVGFAHDGGLSRFADERALPGGVHQRDFDREAAEELADCRNYLVWAIEAEYGQVLAGDPVVTKRYARRMRALASVVDAWYALNA